MGLFDFVKDAGAKILGKETSSEKEAREAAEAAANKKEAAEAFKKRESVIKDAQAKAASKARSVERSAELTKSIALENHVKGLGLKVEKLDVRFDDGVAKITGAAASSSEKEKVVLAVGNVAGVAQVNDQMTVATPEPDSKFYTVVKGDTLSKISKEYYGDPMKYPVIFEANKPMLTDPDLIYPGQVLRIPEQG